MDWLQFFSAILDSLAWPTAAIVAILVMRRPLRLLLPLLRRLRYKDVQLDFEEKLDETEAKVSERVPPEPADFAAVDEDREQEFRLAIDLSPNSAVMEAWIEIERTLRVFAKESGMSLRRGNSVLFLTLVMKKKGLIDAQTSALLDDLRILRNLAVHPSDERQITVEEAERFVHLADQVIAMLRQQLSAD